MESEDAKLGFVTRKDSEVRVARATRVKNKNAAPIQITAEQLLREARERQESEIRAPKQKITDQAELEDYRLRKRREFEDQVRRVGSWSKSIWVKYAQWEDSQGDYRRARSVWERALQVNNRDHTIWLQYTDFIMKNKNINEARNAWDRAVALFPRVDQLWYKYVHMEEVLGNVALARGVFERWMHWCPDYQGWMSYVKFEMRYGEVERARGVFERLVVCHSTRAGVWIKFGQFEMKNGDVERARRVYERGVEALAGEEDDHEDAEKLFLAFARFEEECREPERARGVYKFALHRLPKGRAEELNAKYLAFEKNYGDKEGIEVAILAKKRLQYEDQVRNNPLNYDSWFDYIRLEEETAANQARIRELYERAIANVPPAREKRLWQRYIYLWINYALFEELDAKDSDRARDVYKECLALIPHGHFSFAKIWALAACFEIRHLNLQGARKILGQAIGRAPKDKIFKKYIELELQLGNIDRCRKLYEKYLEWSPENCYAWSKYAQLETSLSETDRARAIFELAIDQPALDMPELLWKAYIDFEIAACDIHRARALYERLLNRTKHLKVWISYAKFEASAMGSDSVEGEHEQAECLRRARGVFERALSHYQTDAQELKEERAMLLEEWLSMESSFGEIGDVEVVRVKLPRKLKKKRPLETEDGPAGFEEYIDYFFPEETHTTNLKILEAAYNWKKQKISPAKD